MTDLIMQNLSEYISRVPDTDEASEEALDALLDSKAAQQNIAKEAKHNFVGTTDPTDPTDPSVENDANVRLEELRFAYAPSGPMPYSTDDLEFTEGDTAVGNLFDIEYGYPEDDHATTQPDYDDTYLYAAQIEPTGGTAKNSNRRVHHATMSSLVEKDIPWMDEMPIRRRKRSAALQAEFAATDPNTPVDFDAEYRRQAREELNSPSLDSMREPEESSAWVGDVIVREDVQSPAPNGEFLRVLYDTYGRVWFDLKSALRVMDVPLSEYLNYSDRYRDYTLSPSAIRTSAKMDQALTPADRQQTAHASSNAYQDTTKPIGQLPAHSDESPYASNGAVFAHDLCFSALVLELSRGKGKKWILNEALPRIRGQAAIGMLYQLNTPMMVEYIREASSGDVHRLTKEKARVAEARKIIVKQGRMLKYQQQYQTSLIQEANKRVAEVEAKAKKNRKVTVVRYEPKYYDPDTNTEPRIDESQVDAQAITETRVYQRPLEVPSNLIEVEPGVYEGDGSPKALASGRVLAIVVEQLENADSPHYDMKVVSFTDLLEDLRVANPFINTSLLTSILKSIGFKRRTRSMIPSASDITKLERKTIWSQDGLRNSALYLTDKVRAFAEGTWSYVPNIPLERTTKPEYIPEPTTRRKKRGKRKANQYTVGKKRF